ncbi:MAG: EAL domain-containing protein [Clostridiales bacterium]|nr:EAL domain-containing protein [Clostridiales bacterium]
MDKSVRKRIALLLGQAEEYSQTMFIEGFLKASFARGMDVFIFSTFIKYQNTPEREVGETSIFDLPNWKTFDAVVVLADTIQTPGAIERIEEVLRANYDGEVVFVEKDSKSYRNFKMDNYTSVKKLICHLIETHGFRDIAFLTGKSWHPHSRIRLEAYKDALTEHGIAVDEDRIFYGDFWYSSGESLADTLLGSARALPQAVACANDCMAIGLAKELSSRGVKVPDDIAVIGYDSNEEGQHAPVPLTSAPVPMEQFGRYSADSVFEILSGREPKPFKAEVDLFIGGSCGCGCDSAKPTYHTRDRWETDLSKGTVFSLFNNMDDDLLGQTTFTGLISTISSYVYQIRDFEDFCLCLNEDIRDSGRTGRTTSSYTRRMTPVIRCGPKGANQDHLDLKDSFPIGSVLPSFNEDRDHPVAYYFMPVNFDDHVFGYAAISYGDKIRVVDPEYRAWLKSVSRGIEYFRRSDEFVKSNAILETGIIRDNLTGLYNYQGFVRQAQTFINMVKNNGNYVGVLVADIKGLSNINREFGREEGDKAIVTVADFLEGTFRSRNSMCLCIGNGELAAVRITSGDNNSELLDLRDGFLAKIDEYNASGIAEYDLDVYCATETGSPSSVDELERMVNVAISKKNNYKIQSNKIESEESLTEAEALEAKIVQGILDDGRMSYSFQPIVRTDNGDIFAYEALMRPDLAPGISPVTVLRYADFFGRLYDVEKITFNNVLKIIREKKEELAEGRKIFINSIPGHMLKPEDMEALKAAVDRSPDSIVVELTEHAEMTDEDLVKLKKTLSEAGVETAVDDYGTGYSNVTNLLRYMPDYVKIDKQLMSGIQDSPQKQHFVKDIIEFSHGNGIMALAEGIETEDELIMALTLGADLIQGYYIAKPDKDLVSSIDPVVLKKIRSISRMID